MSDLRRAAELAGDQETDSWLDPQPVPTSLAPVPVFDVALLPEAFRAWVADIAERVQCPKDYVAIGAMVSLASVVGRQCGIKPKEFDDWLVVPNLWGAGVGPPGWMKTPAFMQAMRPLRALVAAAKQKHAGQNKDFTFHALQETIRQEQIKKEMREAMTEGRSVEHLREMFDAIKAEKPLERRYETNDTTIEKLGVLLNENPNGLLVFRDELPGLFRTMDREGHQNDRPFYDEAWNGDGDYTYDRMERGTLYIEAACVSILGGIQPGPLRHYLLDVFGSGATDDGFIQRFQLLVYPDITDDWKYVKRWPDSEARRRAVQVFTALADLDPVIIGARKPGEYDKAFAFFQFAEEAQAAFDTWYTDHNVRVRLQHGAEHPVVLGHLNKYPKLVPALALLMHLVDCVDHGRGGPVSLAATETAIRWSRYLEAHARRVYETVSNPGRQAAAALGEKIKAGALPSPFVARTVYRKAWSGLTKREEVVAACNVLEELHWIRAMEKLPTERGGAPTTEYTIHPSLPRATP
jgi:putative DNA primase/helicase